MTAPSGGSVIVDGTPGAIWAILDDPDALGRILPGCESIVRDGPTAFRAVLAAKTGLLTIRADVTATYRDAVPPTHLRLDLDGRPRGIGGAFQASVPFDLVALDAGRTEVRYSIDTTVSGALASFGSGLVGGALTGQVDALVRNLEQELARE